MGKVRHKIAVYGKMYGCTLPTVKKLEDAGTVTEIITVAYNAGYSDAETQNNRLAELEKNCCGRIQHAGRVSRLAC